ncbi:NUDIX domain-containing protein [Bacillus manliponensis]|uniref:NUDIX domain-containing protein n=1 Tax=Bacillus manliponensis TaxID=574376 RepID=UPI00351903E4
MQPLLRAEALIYNKNRTHILLQCDQQEKLYRLLGGTIEFGENAKATIERECLEEYDLQTEIECFASVYEHIFEVDSQKYHHCTLLYQCKLEEDDARIRWHKEHSNIMLKWKMISQLEKPIYPEGIMRVIEQPGEEVKHWLSEIVYKN